MLIYNEITFIYFSFLGNYFPNKQTSLKCKKMSSLIDRIKDRINSYLSKDDNLQTLLRLDVAPLGSLATRSPALPYWAASLPRQGYGAAAGEHLDESTHAASRETHGTPAAR